ncbi:MAG: tetratricopeptide repeat protein [Hyphomicrobiales bacterium]
MTGRAPVRRPLGAAPRAIATALATALTLALAAGLAGCAGSRPPEATLGAGVADDPAALVALADSATAAGDAATARRALDRAVAIAPADPRVHLGRGRFLVALRRYHDAKAEFDRAASLDPTSPEPPYQLGLAYAQAGETGDAIRALGRALAIDPQHAGARAALAPLLEARYTAAGVPAEYARIPEQPTVSREELGVILAVELGADPDRAVWRSDQPDRTDAPELDGTWGARWLRASVARRWIEPFPDGSFHLTDPVTRGNLALLLARLSREWGADSLLGGPASAFPDLPPRSYLERSATFAVRVGLPTRDGGRFDPRSAVTGLEALRGVRGLARALGASPAVNGEPN